MRGGAVREKEQVVEEVYPTHLGLMPECASCDQSFGVARPVTKTAGQAASSGRRGLCIANAIAS